MIFLKKNLRNLVLERIQILKSGQIKYIDNYSNLLNDRDRFLQASEDIDWLLRLPIDFSMWFQLMSLNSLHFLCYKMIWSLRHFDGIDL